MSNLFLGTILIGALHAEETSDRVVFFYTAKDGDTGTRVMRGEFGNVEQFVGWANAHLGTSKKRLRAAIAKMGGFS